jgi:hypothetical protein
MNEGATPIDANRNFTIDTPDFSAFAYLLNSWHTAASYPGNDCYQAPAYHVQIWLSATEYPRWDRQNGIEINTRPRRITRYLTPSPASILEKYNDIILSG